MVLGCEVTTALKPYVYSCINPSMQLRVDTDVVLLMRCFWYVTSVNKGWKGVQWTQTVGWSSDMVLYYTILDV